jgi:LmbE family N-acetylglucosaminyl deacetylase
LGDVTGSRVLLFVGAHPDDETFGIGGTLAQYSAAGVRVYYACATRGEAGAAEPQFMKGYASVGDMRWAELECAARVLGMAGVIHLGYRDSGMAGSEENKHPDSLVMAPPEEVAGRIVKIIRNLKPDVVITHDAAGGYGHPDHIAVHHATVKAFHSAGEPGRYLEAGPAFQPSRLYFAIHPHGYLRLMVRLLPLFGQDPRRFGRNKDINLYKMTEMKFPVHASIRLSRRSVAIRDRAAACYFSQGGGRIRQGPLRVLMLAERLYIQRDCFMRASPGTPCPVETDLFAGILCEAG